MEPALSPDERAFGDPGLPRGAARGWDFLGNVPVPLRHHVRDAVAQRVAGLPLKCCFPMGQGGRGPFERLRRIRALDDFPDMLVSAEYGNAFNRRFHAEHVEMGAFTDSLPQRVAPSFEAAGLIDPKGWIGAFAVAPFVLLIDRRKLDGRPVPRRWADLADPVYRDQIVFGGWKREGAARFSSVNLFFLLSLLREFGEDTTRDVLANVPTLLHSAQMPRVAGTNASPGGILVLPWSLADVCPRRSVTEVVWPQEGAFAYPLWMTVKRHDRDRLNGLIDLFQGPDLAAYLNVNRYPSICAEAPTRLATGLRLRFLGWDYLRHRSTADDIRRVRALFRAREDAWLCEREVRRCA